MIRDSHRCGCIGKDKTPIPMRWIERKSSSVNIPSLYTNNAGPYVIHTLRIAFLEDDSWYG